MRANGELAWFDALDEGPFCLPAIGDFDGDGRLEAIAPGFGLDSEICCYDTAQGKLKWKMPASSQSWVLGSASGDTNSDGRDEALLVYDKLLCCLRSDAARNADSILWKPDSPTQIGSPCIADVDRSGNAGLLLVGSDGYV